MTTTAPPPGPSPIDPAGPDDLHHDETNHKLFRSLLVACGVALVAVIAVVVVLVATGGDDAGVTHRYVVPAGTAARLAAGEPVTVMPTRLVVHVGDSLVLRNNDSVTQQMGPLSVNAGGILKMKFTRTGTIEGTCTMNPEGTAKIVIQE